MLYEQREMNDIKQKQTFVKDNTTNLEIRWRARAHRHRTVKQVSYCHLLNSTDMVQWIQVQAQGFVLHSNKITFIPDKVTVLYRNDSFIWFTMQHMHVFFLPIEPWCHRFNLSWHRRKNTSHMYVLKSLAQSKMVCSNLPNTSFRCFMVGKIQSTKTSFHCFTFVKTPTKKERWKTVAD